MTSLLALQSYYLTKRLLINLDARLSPRKDGSLLLFSSLKLPMPVRPPNVGLLLLE